MQFGGFTITNPLAWKNWKDSSEARHSSKFLWGSMGVAGPPTITPRPVTAAPLTPDPDQIQEDRPLQD